MNNIKILFAVFIIALGFSSVSAQDQKASQSSAIMKRAEKKDDAKTKTQGFSPRMEEFYKTSKPSDADLTWMRVIYRSLDLDKEKNQALYFPEEPVGNDKNLFFTIMGLLVNNQIPAYEYLDGKEIFTDQYRIKVKDMLDRFNIIATEAKGSTEKNPKFIIEDSDVPSNEVKSYYILERWEFDRKSNKTKTYIEAICPVLHRSSDIDQYDYSGNQSNGIKYPMFWVKFEDLRPALSQQFIFTDDDNNLQRYSIDDYFNLGMYDGEIYKTRNMRNLSMMQIYNDPDDLKRAQDSIDNRLRNYDKGLWVPSREELAARAEVEAAKKAVEASNDEIASRDAKAVDTKTVRTTSRRGTKTESKPKTSKPKVKQPKVKTSSGNATRSVRRTK